MSTLRVSLSLLFARTAYPESFLEHRSLGGRRAVSKAETAFSDFVKEHGRDYQPGSSEWEERQLVFARVLEEVDARNREPNSPWRATITRFADFYPEERKSMLGYKRHARIGSSISEALELDTVGTFADPLPAKVDYADLPAMQDVQDQSACGSCWAFATTTALRGAYNKATGRDRTFSPQQLVSCTPNPRACGGTGGCDGATVELAMEYIMHAGIKNTKEFRYEAADLPCPSDLRMDAIITPAIDREDFGLTGWRTLPTNRATPLKRALADHGPVAISVAANNDWFMYAGGVVDSCDNTDPIVNHAVVLVGYGKDADNNYWKVQNSWGYGWGEGGFIRVLRMGDGPQGDDQYCGWDTRPEDGVGCKDDNATQVYVCGMCGILFDSVVSYFGKGAHDSMM